MAVNSRRLPTWVGRGRADQARGVRLREQLPRALPKLVDLHLQRSLLTPAPAAAATAQGRSARRAAAVRQVVEHVVCLDRRGALLLVPAPRKDPQTAYAHPKKNCKP